MAVALVFAIGGCGNEPAERAGGVTTPATATAPADSGSSGAESPLPGAATTAGSPQPGSPGGALAEIPGDRHYDLPFRDESVRVDAENDAGWDTEVWQDRAAAVLKEIAHALERPGLEGEGPGLETVEVAVADAFTTTVLRPPVSEVFNDGTLSVGRAEANGIAPNGIALPQAGTGKAALIEVLQQLREPLAGGDGIRVKAKVFSIEPGAGGQFSTQAFFDTFAVVGGRAIQQNATWEIGWNGDPGEVPVMERLAVLRYEEVRSSEGGVLFTDCTESVFADRAIYDAQVTRGVEYWQSRLERTVAPDIITMVGLAVGDANGDGLDDVYVCQPYGLPNRLLIQQADGTVVDTAPASGLDWVDPFSSALFLDLDNDGDQDLVLGADTSLFFHANDGSGKFEPKRQFPYPTMPDSMAAADFDGDGLLDIFVCGHTPAGKDQQESVLGLPVPFYDANNGQPNLLLRNQGDWQFEDVTEAAGLNENNTRFSYAAAWEDYDNDGDLDLYVANDFGRNNLYRNDAGPDGSVRFKDVAAEAGVEDISSGMSADWADYDHDGWMDLYVGNMFSGAGNRITYQRNFRPGEDADKLASMRRMARGNTLFRNTGGGAFSDVSVDMDVTMGRWSWASRFADLNNDGWEDLVIANGFVTNRNPDDL